MQRLNGQTLPEADHPKLKRHTAKLVPFAIRQRIVNALANGDSMRAIARALHVSNNTVVVIREQDWQQVETRKQRIAAQAELNATLAAERITDELRSNKHIPINVLVPVFGVNVDKLLQLRGDAAINVNHHHIHELRQSHKALSDAYLSALSRPEAPKLIEAKVVEETHQLAKKMQRKRAG